MRYLSSFLISIFTICLWAVSVNSVQATHFSGANITYECMSACTYRVYVTEYFYCTGTPIGPGLSGNVNIIPGSGCTSPSAVSGWVNASQSEVTPICPANLSMTSCSGGALSGVMEVVNYRDYDFCSAPCPSYTVEYDHCCRSNSMVNVAPAASYDVFVSTEIYPNGVCNSSPDFLDPSPIYLEEDRAARVSMAAYDADGDSLMYEIVNCSQTGGTPIPYAPGITVWQPMAPNWIIDINEYTGDILFSPNPGSVGTYSLCVQVSEYRNGVLLGTHINDFLVLSLPSSSVTNAPSYIPAFGPPVVGGSYIDSFIVNTTVNTALTIPVSAFDPDQDSTLMTWSANIPGATFSQVGNPSVMDTIIDVAPQGEFKWTPITPGRYSFTIDLEDIGCYLTGNSEYTYVIDVDAVGCFITADLGADIQICTADTAIIGPTVSGGTLPVTYLWSTGETTATIGVSLPGTYYLTVVDANGCMALDTIDVSLLALPTVDAGSDTTICAGETVQLSGSTSASPAAYQWVPAIGLNDPNISNPVFSSPFSTSTTATTFLLTVTDANGCSDSDFVIITALGAIAFNLTANDTICSSDTALIAYTGPSGLSYTWDFGGGTVVSGSGSGPYEVIWAGTGYGNKTVSLTVDDGICSYTESVDVYVDPNCVWPGDADYDGVADNFDLLAIGLSYASTGPLRANASLNWTAQPAAPWNDTIPGGVNQVHSDTDGNGVVNDDDTLAVSLNYGQTHNKTTTEEGGPGDPPLLLLPMLDSALVGTTVSMPIVLGLDTLPADNVYGLAFTITYDNTLVDSATASVDFSSSWLGSIGTNMISIQKDMFNDGEIDVAVTRTDQMNMSGYGNLGYFSIDVDDIAGKNDLSAILHLNITNVKVITNEGEIILVNPEPAQIVVTESSTGLNDWNLLTGVKVYPNPSAGVFSVELEETTEVDIEIYNLHGQKVFAQKSRETMTQIDIGVSATRMYLITISDQKRRWTGKIQITK
ncbi:MAG: T9SS type A sorting domain-containing protein [Bacteroidia bacterium]